MTMREYLVRWDTPAGTSPLTILYFDESGDSVGDQRFLIKTWLDGLATQLSNQVSYAVDLEGRVISEDTGTLVGYWSDTVPQTGNGDIAEEPVADATQGLVRWGTAGFVAGRNVRGRSFIPGLATNRLTSGNMSTTAISGFASAAAALVTSASGLVVWSRPTDSRPGSMHLVSSSSVSAELAVLRRRRG
jgi:hypothetical protein